MNASHTHHQVNILPRGLLISAGVLIAFSIGAAYYARQTGLGRVETPHAGPVASLQLRFEDGADGSVIIRDASRGDVLSTVAPGTGGFVRASLRTLAQARKRDDIGAETPFNLTRWSDGTLSLEDPTTGRIIGLDAFGAVNAVAFAQLFKQREEKP